MLYFQCCRELHGGRAVWGGESPMIKKTPNAKIIKKHQKMKCLRRHLLRFWIWMFRLWRWRRSPEQPGLEGLLVNIIIIMTIDHCDNTMIMLSSCANTMIMLSWLGITWQYYFLSLCLYAFLSFVFLCLEMTTLTTGSCHRMECPVLDGQLRTVTDYLAGFEEMLGYIVNSVSTSLG